MVLFSFWVIFKILHPYQMINSIFKHTIIHANTLNASDENSWIFKQNRSWWGGSFWATSSEPMLFALLSLRSQYYTVWMKRVIEKLQTWNLSSAFLALKGITIAYVRGTTSIVCCGWGMNGKYSYHNKMNMSISIVVLIVSFIIHESFVLYALCNGPFVVYLHYVNLYV